MTDFHLDLDWESMDEADPLLSATAARLKIELGGTCVTRNIDIWSDSPRDEVFVSAYPLACWMAWSWWRLHHEVSPGLTETPPLDWRLSHELGAVGSGYVWPLMMFATDRQAMNIRTEPLPDNPINSLRYLADAEEHAAVPMTVFTETCRNFIDKVVAKLKAEGCANSELEHLWSSIQTSLDDPRERRKRRLEAQFGFDPEECPEELLADLMDIEDGNREDVLAELAAIRPLRDGRDTKSIKELFELSGIEASPRIPKLPDIPPASEPLQRAKADATTLRGLIGTGDGAVKNSTLEEMLDIDMRRLGDMPGNDRRPAALANRIDERRIRFVARKRHPLSRRFELARLIGGYVDTMARDNKTWLALTDATTARQKYQRAFAAEFLCPINPLKSFLDGNFSESAIEEAADEFMVSERTVSAQLVNNHLISRSTFYSDAPYSMRA